VQKKKQIPGGMIARKARANGKGRNRFPEGMTERKARAITNAGISPLRITETKA
jgi:hypothetical protein